MKQILKSPLVYFLVIGSVLFFIYEALEPNNQEAIVVSKQTVEALIKADQELTQTELTEEYKQDLIEKYIDEEVLLREAFKRGLHQSDYRVRKRLLGIMYTSITEIVPEPTLAQLRAYYDENKEKYLVNEALSYETIKFSYNSKNIPKDSKAFLEILENSDDPLQYSEATILGNRTSRKTYQEIAMEYGKIMADSTFAAKMNTWYGPFSSRNDIVYFRVIERHDAYTSEFEDIEAFLKEDYYITKAKANQQLKIEDLRKNYSITLEEPTN